MDWYETPLSTIPFPGGARVLTVPGSAEADHQEGERGAAWLESPFSGGLVTTGAASESEEAFAALAAELEDEEFDEALQALVDEAAGRHLESAGAWRDRKSVV